jgi:hypothetical protein
MAVRREPRREFANTFRVDGRVAGKNGRTLAKICRAERIHFGVWWDFFGTKCLTLLFLGAQFISSCSGDRTGPVGEGC